MTAHESSRINTNDFRHRGTENTEKTGKRCLVSLFSSLTSSLCPLWLCGVLSVCPGCAPYLQAEVDLIKQSRKGMAMLFQSLESQQQTIAEFQHRQRTHLDDAFDTDVREQTSLDASWVIDHRIAYSLALDALNESHHRQQLSHQQDQRTLAAIDLALQQLEWLVSVPLSSKGK